MQIVCCVKHKDKSVDCWLNGRVIAHFPAHYTNKPDKRNRRVIINCNTYLINWG